MLLIPVALPYSRSRPRRRWCWLSVKRWRSLAAWPCWSVLGTLLRPWLADLPPIVVLALTCALTSALTEVVANSAVAVMVTPLVIELAAGMGADPRPFVVAVMFAASATFATPIGYETNTSVYSAGGYRFRDFLRIGLPMNLVMGLVVVTLIPLFWPL